MLERVKFLTPRIKKILEGNGIDVVETANEKTLLNYLNNTSNDISLLLLDIDMGQKKSMNLLIEARQRLRSTPIVIMTLETKKALFVEAMLQGATDFIIKPFTDQLFMEKIHKCLTTAGYANAELITMDLNQYITAELRKAEKGKYPLSLMFMNFQNNSPDKSREYEVKNFIFKYMKKQFWDTDLFIRFASEHCLGIFPFCGEKNTVVLKTKIELKFEALKKRNEMLADYSMICAFISYPYDTNEINRVFSLFISRINSQFQNLRLGIPAGD